MKGFATGLSAVTAFAVFGGWAWAGLEGSKHDFRKQAWSGGETCGVCHTPHRSDPPKAAPLWDPRADLNRRLGSAPARRGPGNGTLSCFRCHDGTVADSIVPGAPRRRFANAQHPGLFTAAHGRSDHPVGVEYPLRPRDYRPATTVLADGTVTLPAGRVECMSCHDPHASAGIDKMLVMSNARSALCLTCHKK